MPWVKRYEVRLISSKAEKVVGEFMSFTEAGASAIRNYKPSMAAIVRDKTTGKRWSHGEIKQEMRDRYESAFNAIK